MPCIVQYSQPPPNGQMLCLSKLHEGTTHLTSTATVCTGRDKGMCTGGGGGGGGELAYLHLMMYRGSCQGNSIIYN